MVDCGGTDVYTANESNQYTDGANVNDTNDNAAHSTYDGRYESAAARPHSIPLTAAPGPLERDGDELFYRNRDKWMAVFISTEPEFTAGTPEVVFEGSYINVPGLS